MSEEQFSRFCVVGLGNHARTKLIPALKANGQQIAIVSSRPQPEFPDLVRFSHISEALAGLPSDTAFVLATPPQSHFDLTMTALEAGRSVVVEKPAFISRDQAAAAFACANSRGLLLVEAMMHRYTALYARLMAWWNNHKTAVTDVTITFCIPAIPAGTFRQSEHIACSVLYDIGCYALSFCADLSFPLDDLMLEDVHALGDANREAMTVAGVSRGVRVTAHVGVAGEYTNEVVFRTREGHTLAAHPVFYGRASQKLIVTSSSGPDQQETIDDRNAFQAMFHLARPDLLATQAARGEQAIRVAEALERLGRTLQARRQDHQIAKNIV